MWFVITIMVLVTFLFSFFYIFYFRGTLDYEFYIFGENFEYYLAIRWEAAIGASALLLKRAQENYSSRKLLTIFLIVVVNFGLTYCFLGS